MRIEASAPGKLVLLGEYAVLEGAPALVLAVDRRAHVRCTPIDDDVWEFVSPTLGLRARLRCGTDGVAWDGSVAPVLEWIGMLAAGHAAFAALPPQRVELDSDAFHFDHAGSREKLGLGSSAALTVALLGAWHALTGDPAPSLGACVAAHRALQHGRGSGIDIAAALAGGLSRFQLDATRAPQCSALSLPSGLHWQCVFSGRPASTAAMLGTIEAWRGREPAAYRRQMGELATIADRGTHAVARDDSADFLACLHDYATALAAFGEASGVDIASAAHRALGRLATDCGVVYKSCGAGGGDVGIACAVDAEAMQAFAMRAAGAGYPLIDMQAADRGLEILAAV